MSIEDINYINEFDAIWACASLLHIAIANFYFLNGIEYIYERPYEKDN